MKYITREALNELKKREPDDYFIYLRDPFNPDDTRFALVWCEKCESLHGPVQLKRIHPNDTSLLKYRLDNFAIQLPDGSAVIPEPGSLLTISFAGNTKGGPAIVGPPGF